MMWNYWKHGIIPRNRLGKVVGPGVGIVLANYKHSHDCCYSGDYSGNI